MGCRVCRARKVKCDGRPNGCRNCERLQLECVGDNGPAVGPRASPVALRKIRTYRSCTNCRLSKTKCNGDRPKCSRCAAKQVECVYDGGSTPRWARNLDKSPPSASAQEDWSHLQHSQSALSVASDEPEVGPGPSAQLRHEANDGSTGSVTSQPSSTPARPPSATFEHPTSDALSWLLSPDLPPPRHLRRVIEQYFANVHPLRCFAFVHKPSFMRQLDRGFNSDDESALLHIMCAHGAKFYVLSLSQLDQTPSSSFIRAAGNQWAKKAEYLMLANFGKISIQRLMAAVLLYDYHFRLGEFTEALMVSGLAVRMAHALKINTEYSPDIMCTEQEEGALSVVARESRRRLMWACYVLDAWTGSGVDQLTLLRENDIKIQLPCNERNFGLRIASVTETLGVGHVLQFLAPAVVPRRPAANMGIMAYYIRIVTLWKRVIRYVSHLDSGPPPWLPESEFTALDADLRLWRRELPDFVEYSTDTIYARLDSNQLGSLVLIHCTYHHNFLELYKFSMPDLFKLQKPFDFPPEHQEFLQIVQADAYYHAQQIATILAEAAEHGSRLLSDSLLPFLIYDSSRVMLYYVARLLDPNRPDAKAKAREAIKAVESNSRVLMTMAPLFPIGESLSSTIERWLSKIRQTIKRSGLPDRSMKDHDVSTNGDDSIMGEPSGYLLPSISLIRNGRQGLGDIAADGSTVERGPDHEAAWDQNSAAQQLVGLSQEGGLRSTLHHERPVAAQALHPQLREPLPGPEHPIGEALDLDDLQSFLSWDMYGFMEISDVVSNNGTENSVVHSWVG